MNTGLPGVWSRRVVRRELRSFGLIQRQPEISAPARFGLVERTISPLEEFFRLEMTSLRAGYADTGTDIDIAAFQIDRDAHRFANPACDRHRPVGIMQVFQRDDEFIAAQTGDRIGVPGAARDPPRKFAQDTIACRVAVGVVDLLEMVYFKARQCRGRAEDFWPPLRRVSGQIASD